MVDVLLGSFVRRMWPARSVDRLLRAALLEDPSGAAASWQAFEASADFDHLTPGEMRLIALVSKRLVTLAPASPMRARIGGLERAQWSRSQLAIAEAGTGLRALEAERVSMLVFKGASRAAMGGAMTRGLAATDIDVVLKPDDLPKALELLTRAGWRPVVPATAFRHQRLMAGAGGIHLVREPFGSLRLHRRVFRSPHASETEDASVWQRSTPGRIAGADVRLPSATDATAIALAQGRLDGRECGDCLADVATAIDCGVNWELFGSIANRHRLDARGALVLRYVRDRLERSMPDSLLRALEGMAMRRPLPVLAALARWQARASRAGLARAVPRWRGMSVPGLCRFWPTATPEARRIPAAGRRGATRGEGSRHPSIPSDHSRP